MSAKERLLLFALLLVAMLLLPIAVKASTEDEIVREHIAKIEKKQTKILFSPFVSFTLGSVSPDRYDYFAEQMNSAVSRSGGGETISTFGSISAIDVGFGIVHGGGQLTFAFSWWGRSGSANTGDFTVLQDFGSGTATLENFEFTSQIRVYGVYVDYQYFLVNAPKPHESHRGLALRAGAGAGYFGARWYLWDGFGGYRQDTGEYYELDGHLSGSSGGYHLGVGIEYPLWKGLVIATDARYQWLEFDRLSKAVDATMDLYLIDADTGGPIKVDMTGPRINFVLKTYFAI